MSELAKNTDNLNTVLEMVNSLPDAGSEGGGTGTAVLYTAQELNEAQKAQARENIGAAPVSVDTTTDPGAGAAVSYPNGTEINVYEPEVL